MQLRLEKNELLTAYDEILFENGSYAGGKSSSTSKDVEKDSRSLEQKLEGMDLVLAQKARNAEKVTLAINDVKVGVQHIVKMLQANERLLKNIPAAAPVKLLSDDDISRALSWCEERVIAVNEALVLDSSKPTETYDTRPLPERQIELARLVHGMTSKDTPKSPSKIKREIKKAGAISEQIVSSEGNAIVITPRAVMVRFDSMQYDKVLFHSFNLILNGLLDSSCCRRKCDLRTEHKQSRGSSSANRRRESPPKEWSPKER